MSDYIDENNRITAKNLVECNTSDVIPRLTEVFEMARPYMLPEMKFVDVGCRDGYLIDILKQNGFDDVEGVEMCEEAVEVSISRGFTVYNINAEEMPIFDDESVDFFFAIHTLEHLLNPEKCVNEMYRILKPNGMVLIEVPVEKPEVVNPPEKFGHYHPFTAPSQMEELFRNFGMVTQLNQTTKSNKPWYRWIWRKV
jgi:ubiquinone/menaquinone biosynthesis C-methylase UbiE